MSIIVTLLSVLTALMQSDLSRGLKTKTYQDMDVSISIRE